MTTDTSSQYMDEAGSPTTVTKRDKIKFLTHEVKANVKELVRHQDGEKATSAEQILEDATFDPQVVLRPEEADKGSIKARMNIGAKTVVNTIKNPKAVFRNNYARHAATKIANHPQNITVAFDREFVNAHDALVSAQADVENENSTELTDAQARLDRIEKHLEDLDSGWILGRHVIRVRAINSTSATLNSGQRQDGSITHNDPQGILKGSNLGRGLFQYAHQLTAHRVDDFDEPPFSLRELGLAIERFAAVSSPWQSFFWELREVYRWEHPLRTFELMVAFWILWYIQHIMTFMFGCVIYLTVRNRFHSTTVEVVRERVQRSEEQAEQVRAWNELIQKYGSNDWIEPFLDGIGPHMQMQIGDISSLLERFHNLYTWERPKQTLMILLLCFLIFCFVLLGSIELCVKTIWFGVGSSFFFSFPVISIYPRYRHLARFWFWFLWEMPDAAEAAIDRLQKKVAERDMRRVSALDIGEMASTVRQHSPPNLKSRRVGTRNPAKVDTSTDTFTNAMLSVRDSDRLEFQAIVLPSHEMSKIVLTRNAITFESSDGRPSSYHYSSVIEVRKVDLSTASKKSSSMCNKDKLSRSSHLTRWLERAATMQLSPDGLEFIFGRTHDPYGAQDSGSLVEKEDPSIEQHDVLSVHNVSTTSVKADSFTNHSRTESLAQCRTGFTLVLNKSDRDKIFTVVLAWSGLRWQPLYSSDQRQKLGSRLTEDARDGKDAKAGDLNDNLDDAIKRGLS